MNQSENLKSISWALLIGVLVGLASLITFGIDMPMWRFYGALYNEFLIKPNIYAIHSLPFIEIREGMGAFIRYFHKLMIPVYDIAGYYMIVGTLFKVGSFLAVYYFLRTLLIPFWLSLVFGTFFCLFSTPFAQAGGTAFIIGGVAPLKATLAGIFTLLGLSFGIRQRLFWSAVFFGLSIQFHLFCGATGFIFSFPFIFCFNDIRPRFWPRWVLFFLILVGFSANYVLAGKVGSDVDLQLDEWYLILKNFGDTYTFDSLLPFISIFATNLFIMVNFQTQNESDFIKKLERATYYSLAMILGFLLLDHIHDRKFFLGPLSEIYVVLEVRRGLWIPGIALTALVWRKVYGAIEKMPSAKYSWLLFAMILLVAQRYNLIMSVMLLISFWLARKELGLNESFFLKTAFLLFGILVIAEIYIGTLPYFTFLPIRKFIVFLVVIAGLLKFYSKNVSELGKIILAAVMLTHFITDGHRTLKKEQGILKNLSEMKKVGAEVWQPMPMDKIIDMSLLPRTTSDIPYMRRFIALSEIVKKNNTDQTGLVWTPISVEPYYYKSPLFFDPFWSMYGSYYSRVLADKFQKRTMELYNLNIQQLFNGNEYKKKIEDAHNNLPEDKVISIMKKYNVRFVLSKAKYKSLKLLGEAEEYMVYELAL